MKILYGAARSDELREHVARRIEDAARQHPNTHSIQFDLANLRILQGRYADAEAIFRAIHERDKSLAGPMNNLAWILTMRGSHSDEALALIQRAIDLEGETPDYLDTRAIALLASGQPEPAIQDLKNAVAVDPKPEKFFHLARAPTRPRACRGTHWRLSARP